MPLNPQSYLDYLRSIQPAERPVRVQAEYDERDVRVIDVRAGSIPMPDFNLRTAPQTVPTSTAPVFTLADAEAALEEWDEELIAEEGDEIMSDVLVTAVENTLAAVQLREEKKTAPMIVRNSLLFQNPWELFDEKLAYLLTLEGFPEALEILFVDTVHHLRWEQCKPEVNRMVQWLIVSARIMLDRYQEIERTHTRAVDEAKHTVAQLRADLRAQQKAAPSHEADLSCFWEDEFPVDPDEALLDTKPVTPLEQAEAELKRLYANRPKHEQGTRPVDIYRLYAKALRVVRKAGFTAAGAILRDLQLAASTPFADMDNPDHIDPYTGEFDPVALEYRVRVRAPARVVLTSERPDIPPRKNASGALIIVREDEGPDYGRVAQDLGWTPDQLEAHAAAQEGYSVEPDEDPEVYFNEFFQDMKAPAVMEMQHDFATTDAFSDLRNQAKPYIDRCREYVNEVRRVVEFWFKKFLIPGDGQPRDQNIFDVLLDKYKSWEDLEALEDYLYKLVDRDWPVKQKVGVLVANTLHNTFQQTDHAREFIEFLKEQIIQGANETDVAMIFLSLQNGLMFPMEAAMEIKLSITGISGTQTLFDFIEENEEELLANLNDMAPRRWDEPWDLVNAVAQQGLSQALATADARSSNVRFTPEYIEGYIRAGMTVKTISWKDAAGYHNALEEAGWSNFRMKRSPKGAELYSQARARAATQRQAMAAFWKQYGLEQRRKAECRVKGTWREGREVGLTLINGRKITFNVAVMKFNNGEFEHSPGEWAKIVAFLRSQNIGGYFRSLVEKKLATA